MLKRITSMVLVILVVLSASVFSGAAAPAESNKYIDNSSLLPKWVPDSKVRLDENNSPDWTDDLIIVAANLHRVLNDDGADRGKEKQNLKTPDNRALKLLDHIAEMGANCLWITPVYERGTTPDGRLAGNGYGSFGPDTIDQRLTGAADYAEGWQILKKYIDEAHKRNIRVILDVVSWGVGARSPLYKERKDDISWFTDPNLSEQYEAYFNWNESNWYNDDGEIGLKEWFVQQVVNIALVTGCDGFRYDLEPTRAGPLVDLEIKNRLLKKGRKILAMSEGSNERALAYDLEQSGVRAPSELQNRDAFNYLEEQPMLKYYNMVNCIKQGIHIGSDASQLEDEGASYKYYTHAISNHDYTRYISGGNRLVMGYQAIYSPFIPLWYVGEETLAKKVPGKAVLYDTPVDVEEDLKNPEAREFYESVKQMIRIRRKYKELFVNFSKRFRDTNICKVNVDNCEGIQPYARYAGNKAVLVIPNYNIHNPSASMKVHMPFQDTGLTFYSYYTVTDLISGKVIAKGTAAQVASFTVKVPVNNQQLLLVEAKGKFSLPQEGVTLENETSYSPVDVDEEDNSIEETAKKKKKKVVVTKRKKKAQSDSVGSVWPYLLAGGIAVVLAAGGTVAVILIKKRKKKNNEPLK